MRQMRQQGHKKTSPIEIINTFVSRAFSFIVQFFYAGIDLDEARRKREDNIVQLRKDKRDESLQKKRMVSSTMAPNDIETIPGPGGVQKVNTYVEWNSERTQSKESSIHLLQLTL